MRKILFILSLSLLFSCSSTKTVRDSRKTIKGEWVLNSINYNQSGTYEISLLNDVSKQCFEKSTWKFIPNNYKGTYIINDTHCKPGERYFNFTIKEEDNTTGLYNFLLKPTDIKGKSETNQGFRLALTMLSETNMTWQQTLSVDGKPFTINMNFSKL